MIKAILFDLDGTLLNRDESLRRFCENQYERLKKWLGHIPKDRFLSRFIELDERGYVWKDVVYQRVVEEFNLDLATDFLLQDYMEQFKYNCVPFPNLTSTLDALKRESIRLAIISNGKGQFQMDNIRALGIEHYFDTILISEWEGIKKPDPEIFQRALRALDVTAEESVYVGDHPENDIKGAKNIGMIGIWKKDYQWENGKADFVIDDLIELLQIPPLKGR